MSEYAEQVIVMDWARSNQNTFPDLKYLFHIPNGGFRDVVTGSRMKRAGVKKGVPDLFLPVSNHLWHGLWIEMKDGKGVQSDEQIDWESFLYRQGYKAIVCYSGNEAIRALQEYLVLGVTF